jgi:hypothetical protein
MVGPLKKEGDKRKEEIFDYYICFRDAKTRTENLPKITHPRLPPVKDESEAQFQSLCPFLQYLWQVEGHCWMQY